MKKLSVLLLLLATTCLGLIAHPYLQIKISKHSTEVNYPPNTPFELLDEKGNLVVNESTLTGELAINTFHKLIIHPSWKITPEVFEIVNGKIAMVTYDTDKTNKIDKIHSYGKYKGNYIKSEMQLSPSLKIEGNQNLIFTTTNGLVFSYTDGAVTAQFNGENVAIEGRYLIQTNVGLFKVSYNPKNAKLYWVFEADEN